MGSCYEDDYSYVGGTLVDMEEAEDEEESDDEVEDDSDSDFMVE